MNKSLLLLFFRKEDPFFSTGSATSSLAAQTHPDRGLPIAQLLVTLDPLNPQSYDRLAEAFYWSRRYDEAASALDHAVLLRGGATVAEAVRRGMIALMRGDPAAAAAICAGERSWRENLILALADHQLGRLREAAIQAGRVHDALHDAGAYQYGELAAQWGKPDEALGWLETAVRLRDHGLTRISVDQFLDPVRDTPRFGAVVRALNLPK